MTNLDRGPALIGLTVSSLAAISPRLLLRIFGIDGRQATGAAAFGWRLFAVRTAAISAASLAGNTSARDAFLPVQVADQVVFAHALRSRSIPRRSAVMAMATSGAIIVLDLAARRTR